VECSADEIVTSKNQMGKWLAAPNAGLKRNALVTAVEPPRHKRTLRIDSVRTDRRSASRRLRATNQPTNRQPASTLTHTNVRSALISE
jgi:hypothetical protein